MFVLRACLCHTKWLHGWGSQPQSWSNQPQSWSKSYLVVFHPIVEQLTVSISFDSFSSLPWVARAEKVRKLCNLKPVTDRHTTTTSDQGPTSAHRACMIISLILRRSAIPPNTPSQYKITNPKRGHLSNQDSFLILVKTTGYDFCVSTWAIHFTRWYCITLWCD